MKSQLAFAKITNLVAGMSTKTQLGVLSEMEKLDSHYVMNLAVIVGTKENEVK